MIFKRTHFVLAPKRRGFHLVTDEVMRQVPDLGALQVGMLQLFLQHTSASLTVNENADPDVRQDLEMAINRVVPEAWPYTHRCEGPDDMPAHLKSSMMGCSLLLPVSAGRLELGTWQGIYLCEHRDRAGGRHVVATAWGQQSAETEVS